MHMLFRAGHNSDQRGRIAKVSVANNHGQQDQQDDDDDDDGNNNNIIIIIGKKENKVTSE